jgi:hypothetical protein
MRHLNKINLLLKKKSLFYCRSFSAVSPEIRLPKTFSALYLWKSNLNEITGNHANENYEINMWGKSVKEIRNLNS